jgi:hypothetical protein
VRRNENTGMGINGRPVEALRRSGDGSVAVGRCLGGGIWILGRLGEERTRGGGRGCTAERKKMGKKEETVT